MHDLNLCVRFPSELAAGTIFVSLKITEQLLNRSIINYIIIS